LRLYRERVVDPLRAIDRNQRIIIPKEPATGLAVTVEQAFAHCPKALVPSDQ
jgi:hypothetical protein